MAQYSTVQTAKRLGLSTMTLHRYIRARKIPVPKIHELAGVKVRVWTEEDIERVRQLLPKIANGRKTRHQKKQLATDKQQLAKPKTKEKKPPPSTAVPHKQPKKK